MEWSAENRTESREQETESREKEAARMQGVFLEMGEGSTRWGLFEEEARKSLGKKEMLNVHV